MDTQRHRPRGRRLMRAAAALVAVTTLTACSFLPSVGYRNPAHLTPHNVTPRALPLSPYGNSPYTVNGRTYYPLKTAAGYRQRGIASWYGRPFNGQKTSDGETYNMYAMTAASKVLPLPCYVLVRNLNNNRSVIVRINDRGPFYPHRIIDLSYAAAARLGVLATGTAPVLVEGLRPGGGISTHGSAPPPVHRQKLVFGRHHSTHRSFFVQFGAFSYHHAARELVRELHAKGAKGVRIFPIMVKGRKLYTVRIGPEVDRHAARLASSQASREGLGPTIIVDP